MSEEEIQQLQNSLVETKKQLETLTTENNLYKTQSEDFKKKYEDNVKVLEQVRDLNAKLSLNIATQSLTPPKQEEPKKEEPKNKSLEEIILDL